MGEGNISNDTRRCRLLRGGRPRDAEEGGTADADGEEYQVESSIRFGCLFSFSSKQSAFGLGDKEEDTRQLPKRAVTSSTEKERASDTFVVDSTVVTGVALRSSIDWKRIGDSSSPQDISNCDVSTVE